MLAVVPARRRPYIEPDVRDVADGMGIGDRRHAEFRRQFDLFGPVGQLGSLSVSRGQSLAFGGAFRQVSPEIPLDDGGVITVEDDCELGRLGLDQAIHARIVRGRGGASGISQRCDRAPGIAVSVGKLRDRPFHRLSEWHDLTGLADYGCHVRQKPTEGIG